MDFTSSVVDLSLNSRYSRKLLKSVSLSYKLIHNCSPKFLYNFAVKYTKSKIGKDTASLLTIFNELYLRNASEPNLMNKKGFERLFFEHT